MKNRLLKIVTLLIVVALSFSVFGCNKALSAYEIAVKNGFNGTEKQWLESLHGADGADGRDGEAGKDGENATALTIEDIYQSAVKNGYDKDFLTFVKEYLEGNVEEYNVQSAVNKALLSAVDVIACFDVLNGSVIENGYAAGSGVIYDLDKENGNALILTNFHVIYTASAYGAQKTPTYKTNLR